MVVGEIEIGTDVLVIGSGPAGYTAAIRCGQLGLDATLAGPQLGGVCLNLGCIPYKSLLYSLNHVLEAREAGRLGVEEKAAIDLKRAQEWKGKVIARLRNGITRLLDASGVQALEGMCSFASSSEAVVQGEHGSQRVRFRRAVIATGSHFRQPAGVRLDGKRAVSPYALASIEKSPVRAAVLGGGVSGANVVSLLAKMGTEVALAYKGRSLLPWIDEDVQQPAIKWLESNRVKIYPSASWKAAPDGSSVRISSGGTDVDVTPDLAVFVTPQEANTAGLNLGVTGVKLDERGFVQADDNYRTTDPSIYAIGDVLGGARNACTAYRDGASVASVLAGKPGLPGYQAMPLTIYTEPPIACAGMTEKEAKNAGIEVVVGRSPYSACGAATLTGHDAGFAKVVAEKGSGRILGVHIVGRDSTNLIAEGLLAIEMGARLEDVVLTLHPHPELCEVFYDACARAAGLSTNTATKK